MFAFLRGTVASKQPGRIELDVGGVGYEVFVPESTYGRLTTHQDATLLTYCHIREDAFVIFGFLREEEKALFRELLSINGVGPKVALAVLSRLGVGDFGRAILDQDVDAFVKVPGVGKKMATRLVVEMKSRMGQDTELSALLGDPAAVEDEGERDDVIDALCALGCTPLEAKRAAAKARASLKNGATDEDIVKAALQTLARV